jgi:inner membrane transporter RhtA
MESPLDKATSPTSAVRADPAGGNSPAPVVTRRDSGLAVLLVVVVGMLMQAGSAVAVMVIDSVGVIEAVWLRTMLAAVMLAAVRPRWIRLPQRDVRWLLLALTISLVAMNFSFYEAISRVPVGIVVAVEFLGPLSVAIAGSRRLLDFVWVLLAGVGVWLLARPNGSVGLVGLGFALAAAACWAAFIVLAKRTVSRIEPLRATTLMLAGAAVILTPVWLVTGVKVSGHGRAILLGLCVAILSSALPYFLELAAIKRVRASTYGILLSIEPAIAGLMGFLILSQRLARGEIVGILAIVAAAAGASWLGASAGRRSARAGGRRWLLRHSKKEVRPLPWAAGRAVWLLRPLRVSPSSSATTGWS